MKRHAGQLQDTLTAIRHRVTLREAGRRLFPNGERHLRAREELARLYPRALLDESVAHRRALPASPLDELRYQYPREIVPGGPHPVQLSAAADGRGRPSALARQVRRHACAR